MRVPHQGSRQMPISSLPYIERWLDTQDRHRAASTVMNSLNRFTDPVYCLMRLIVGLMLACHGGQLVLGMFGGMPGSDSAQPQIGGWIMLIGGFMIALGLFTHLAAFICSGTFAYAYFTIHVAAATSPMAKFFPIATAGKEFSNHGELAVFYCWVFFFMFFYGPGRWSLDALLFKRGSAAPTTAT
jgi:putative oxidoreductase